MKDIDIRKKIQDDVNNIINKSMETVPEEMLSPQLIDLLKGIMYKIYERGMIQGFHMIKKTTELIENDLKGK